MDSAPSSISFLPWMHGWLSLLQFFHLLNGHERLKCSVCLCSQSLNCVQLFTTPWTVARQTPLCPWDVPGKNTGVGCHFLLQGILPPKDQTCVSCIGRCILYHWAIWEACTSLLFGCYYHYYLDLNFNLNVLRCGPLSLSFTCTVSTTWPMLPMSFVCLSPVGIWAGDEPRPKLGNYSKCLHLFFHSLTNKSFFSQASTVTVVEFVIIMFNS